MLFEEYYVPHMFLQDGKRVTIHVPFLNGNKDPIVEWIHLVTLLLKLGIIRPEHSQYE